MAGPMDPDRPRSLALPWNLDLFPTTACTVVAAAGLTIGVLVFRKGISDLDIGADQLLFVDVNDNGVGEPGREPLAGWRDPYFLLRQPWRFLGATLPHVNWIHLIFNLIWMVDLGKLIEGRFGSLRTLGIYALLGLASSAAQVGLDWPGWGLSGVLYGCFGFLWVMSRHDVLELHGCLSRNTEQVLVVWFFLCILLTMTGIMSIGNVAHGAGALVGWLLGMAVVSGARRRPLFVAGVAAAAVVGVLSSTVLFPYLNWHYWVPIVFGRV